MAFDVYWLRRPSGWCHYGFAELRFADDRVWATALSDDCV
jgi:hypothetical protein